jgi:ubiquinone/menaquinone biosynthesis C-methylase UbiE
MPEKKLEQRKQDEIDFHNKLREVVDDEGVMATHWSPELEPTIQNNELWRNMKYYAIERKSREFTKRYWEEKCPGAEILDYACGNGEDTRDMAKLGAKKVTGIDISDVSVENGKKLAKEEGLEDKTEFLVADCEETGFEDNSFDLMNEYGCFHHLDLNIALPELARIMKPSGSMITAETLGHNPIISWYRNSTPELRTPYEAEHILKKEHYVLMKKYFNKVEIKHYHLFTLAAVPFRNMFFFNPLLAILELLDAIFLKIPGIRWQAWHAICILSEPKKL